MTAGRIGAVRSSGEVDGAKPAARIDEEESMSEEQDKREETEVEGHLRRDGVYDDEPADESESADDFEAHKFRTNIRMD